MDHRVLIDGQHVYLCRWRDEVDCTWEPEENIYCTQMIVDFKDRLLKQGRVAASANTGNGKGVEHVKLHINGSSLKRLVTANAVVRTENHGWSAVVSPGRAACLPHNTRTDRCRSCSLHYCSVHKAERIDCADCSSSLGGTSMFKPCQVHKPFPPAIPIWAPLNTATAVSQYHAATAPCTQLQLSADKTNAFRRRVRLGSKLLLGGAETVTAISRSTTLSTLTLGVYPALRGPYARNTRVYSVQHTAACWECSKLRRPRKRAAVDDSVTRQRTCRVHANKIRACKLCKARFTTCPQHVADIKNCTTCAN